MQPVQAAARTRSISKSAVAAAAVISKPGEIQIENVTCRNVGPREVRVRLEGCGVCASNLPVWEGKPWFEYPLAPGAPGHEGWGRVEAVGTDVEELEIEDRVAMLSSNAYATYEVVQAENVIKLPRELDAMPFPGEPLGCAMNIFKRCGIRSGETVAIVGIGFLGALLTRLVSCADAKVIAVSRRSWALETARLFGADEVFTLKDEVTEQIGELTEHHGCDCVIEVVGNQTSLDIASNLTAERGRLVIAGYHQDGPRMVNMQQWNWKGLDVINAHERDPKVYLSGVADAIEAVRTGRIDPTPLFTHTYSLDKLGDAFTGMTTRPDGFMKALVTM